MIFFPGSKLFVIWLQKNEQFRRTVIFVFGSFGSFGRTIYHVPFDRKPFGHNTLTNAVCSYEVNLLAKRLENITMRRKFPFK
jgi:hypothetical protein